MTDRVHRRPERQPVTVVLASATAYVEGIEPDELQLLALSAGLPHRWDSTRTRWEFAAADLLPIAAALRTAGRAVRLATTPTPTREAQS